MNILCILPFGCFQAAMYAQAASNAPAVHVSVLDPLPYSAQGTAWPLLMLTVELVWILNYITL